MKNLLFVLSAIAMLTSCKKDTVSEPASSVKYNNETHELNNGYLESYGLVRDGLYSFDIWLSSNDVIITQEDISGVGNVVNIAFLSASSTELAAGTYTFSTTLSTPYTFYYCIVGIDYDIANENGTRLPLVGGTIVIAKEGSNYEITLNGVLVNGKTLTAYYKGILILYDFTA